ncbi:MAG TPA: hemerythrin domain-containing protein [Candidatus Aquilonibacter sp.]|nr:hemerythrin domain-containing protein [Candidatus Aquilonibacter sp.]
MEYKPIISDDVTELILDDHATFRRLFARLDETSDVNDLRHLWFELGPLLRAHAVAEEESFYPELLKAASDDDDVRDAIKDHNQIRDAVNDADNYDVGSVEWRAAVIRARDANSDHMAEEERGPLAAARRAMNMDERIHLGLQFLRLRNAFPSGRTGADDHDKDPRAYVEEHKRS